MSMRFPRYIFAIGGAGKNLIYTVLEKEWILRELIVPKPTTTTVDIVIIDSAIQEENDDIIKIRNIRNKITEIQNEYSNSPAYAGGNVGRVNIDYKLLTKQMILNGPYDLLGIGASVKAATGEPVWWLDDAQLGDDWGEKIMNFENLRNSNFALGVYRKRAIGKAIYYKALAARLFNPNILQNDQVDIIAGIGGGTGSGMAIDIAKKLKKIQNNADITLFGVLSTLKESPEEKANSFAMLGELEYGKLSKDGIFKHIVLVPMEMTEFPGRLQAKQEHETLLREFDETFPNILVSYHNTPAQKLFDTPDFAPFTIATSQLVRYNVDSIKKFKIMLDEAFQDKETSLKDEEYTYSVIKKLIDKYYTEERPGFLLDADKSFIEDRFAKFNNILDNEFFKELEYNSVTYVKSAVDAGIKDIIGIEKQVQSVRDQVGMTEIEENDFKDDVDTRLYKILKKDTEIIDVLKNTFNSINKVQDDMVKDAFKFAVKTDKIGLSRKARLISDEISNLSSSKKTLEQFIVSKENEMKEYEEKVGKDVKTKSQEWKNNNSVPIEKSNTGHLDTIDELSTTLEGHFADLKNRLNIYASKMNSINVIADVNSEPTRDIEDILGNIYKESRKIGIEYEDKQNAVNKDTSEVLPIKIVESLNILKELRRTQIEAGKKLPILDKGLKLFMNTDRVRRIQDAKERINGIVARLHNGRVFELNGNTFVNVYKFDIKQRTSEKKVAIVNTIMRDTKNMFPNADQQYLANLARDIEDPKKRQDINIENIVRSHLGYDAEKELKEKELKEKKSEIDQTIKRMDMFAAIGNELTNMKSVIDKYSSKSDSYYECISNIRRDAKAMYQTRVDNIRYVTEMQPKNIFKATAVGANINNILVNQSEVSTLRQNLEDGIRRNTDNKYNVLLQRTIQSLKDRWTHTKGMHSFVTIVSDSDNKVLDFAMSQQIVRQGFSLDPQNYSDWQSSWGDSWGVGLVLFISGVPFDNIHNVACAKEGYYDHYRSLETGKMFFHHSYMLEKGKLIKRTRVLNLEVEEDKKLLFQDGKDIEKTLLGLYEEVEIKSCL